MRQDTKLLRQEQIENAAYLVLEEKGYAGASMGRIARQAKASNETLYSWYGDKQGLFKALVTRNATQVRSLLEAERTSGQDPLSVLEMLGPTLLDLLLGNRAVALNRAAAADSTGELGETISKAGRESILPLIEQVMINAKENKQLSFQSPGEAAALYIDLLVGDLQIRRVIGQIPQPSQIFCKQRAQIASSRLSNLLS